MEILAKSKQVVLAPIYNGVVLEDLHRELASNVKMKPVALDQLLPKMVETIVTEVDPEQVILFGSHARGDASEDSDIDLIVVETEPFDKNRDRGAEAVRLWRALTGFAVSKDILVYSRDEVEYWRDSLNHVLARALREGRVLYERP